MPARIVVVLKDRELAEAAVSTLVADGLSALAFYGPLEALNHLEQAQDVELLVASSYFGEGKPNGASLALMTRRKRPHLKVIFTAPASDVVPLLQDIGSVILEPISTAGIAQAVRVTIIAQ